MDIRVNFGTMSPRKEHPEKENEVAVVIVSPGPNVNSRPSVITTIPSRTTYATSTGSGDTKSIDPHHEERLRHHHRYLHPCYSKGLDDDRVVRVWAIINMILALADTAFAIVHLLIANDSIEMTETYSRFYNLFHGLECDIMAETGLALHCTILVIYSIGSAMLVLAVFVFKGLDNRVHLSNWYMHLCGLPLVGILARIPIGIVSSHSCSMDATEGTVASYWAMNTVLFLFTGLWVFYMHSITHLFIHWLKTPVLPITVNQDTNTTKSSPNIAAGDPSSLPVPQTVTPENIKN